VIEEEMDFDLILQTYKSTKPSRQRVEAKNKLINVKCRLQLERYNKEKH